MNILYTVHCLRTTIQATFSFQKILPIAKPFQTWGVPQNLEVTSPHSQSLYTGPCNTQISGEFRRPVKYRPYHWRRRRHCLNNFQTCRLVNEVTETRLHNIKQCELLPGVSASIHVSLISYCGRKLHRERNHSTRRLTGSDSHYGPVQGVFLLLCNSCGGAAVGQWLRCCATNRKVAGSIPAGVIGIFIDIKSFRSHYAPGVDSTSNGNDYQEHFLGVKEAGA